ncbi:MAG TPA: serine hydrolase [Candidatus Saccharimonadales bacterium]|nr:serine hydrolase [Candidatus Saccharimonadales bacterium]
MKKKSIFTKFITVLVLAGVVIVAFHFVINPKARAQTKNTSALAAKPLDAEQLGALQNNINTTINANPDIDVAVSIVDLGSGQTARYGITDPFEAASTAKLITAADYLHHVEEGDASLNDQINGSSAQYELQQMIVVSDDNAWQAFNDDLGHPDLQSYASSIGLTDYNPDDNTMPANDIALLLQKLYRGQLLDKAHTDLLLGYMSRANYTGYIEAEVPGGVKFYHKAGLLQDRVHDAAIIDNGKRAIILVIFTKNEDDENDPSPAQTQIIQQITTSVLNAYSIN